MLGIHFSESHRIVCKMASGLLRAAVVLVCISLTLLACLLSTAKAKVGESLVHFGEQLSALTQAKAHSAETRLHINGLHVHRITASTPLDVREALNRMQGFCSEHGGIETPDALLKSAPIQSIQPRAAALGGIYRHESKDAGVLACIDTQRPLGISDLTPRLQAFAKTGNLSAIGRLRYVLARREQSVTSLLVLWTEGDAPLLQMFPKAGDAPGNDVPDIPRPATAVRIFSASEDGAPYSVTMYRSSTPSAVSTLDWYKAQLKQRGWHVIDSKQPEAMVAQHGSRTVLISSAVTGAGQIATTIAEL